MPKESKLTGLDRNLNILQQMKLSYQPVQLALHRDEQFSFLKLCLPIDILICIHFATSICSDTYFANEIDKKSDPHDVWNWPRGRIEESQHQAAPQPSSGKKFARSSFHTWFCEGWKAGWTDDYECL